MNSHRRERPPFILSFVVEQVGLARERTSSYQLACVWPERAVGMRACKSISPPIVPLSVHLFYLLGPISWPPLPYQPWTQSGDH